MVVLSESKNSASSNESMKNLNESMETLNEALKSDMQRPEQWPSAANPFVYYVPYAGGANIPNMMSPLPWWSIYGTWPFPFVNPIVGNFGQQQDHEKESSSSGSVTHASEVVDQTLDAGEGEENASISSKKRKEEKHVRGFVPYKRYKMGTGEAEVSLGL